MAADFQKELLSALISDIKHYSGSDPLRPWLHGIRRLKDSLPPPLLRDKLPRFLQKCAQAFEQDRRYRNDRRYLRVWIELMDYVDDPKVVLQKMEKNRIGLRRASFYLAYALYYEKRKKFGQAEKMYHLGVQNLAEPVAELQKSYEQYLHRMQLYKKRKSKSQEAKSSKGESNSNCINQVFHATDNEDGLGSARSRSQLKCHTTDPNNLTCHSNDDTSVVKFVDSALIGKSETEDACHHGLVDPTINMKEAINAISSMFQEPLQLEPALSRRSQRSRQKGNQQSNGFEIFVDEDGPSQFNRNPKHSKDNAKHNTKLESLVHGELSGTEFQKPFVGVFEILADDEEEDRHCDKGADKFDGRVKDPLDDCFSTKLSNLKYSKSDDFNMINSGPREDTVIQKFVGSAVFGEPKVENACHHGLVDPTVNLKEAMDDINSMFGKPLNFVKCEKPKRNRTNVSDQQPACGFSILADDDIRGSSSEHASTTASGNFGAEVDLFEPTIFTREALAEINDMFGKSLDF